MMAMYDRCLERLDQMKQLSNLIGGASTLVELGGLPMQLSNDDLGLRPNAG